MAKWKPTKAERRTFYEWAMKQIQGDKYIPPAPGIAENVDTRFYIWALKQIYGDKCFYCDQTFDTYRREHKDGSPDHNFPENYCLACNSCNQLKRQPLPQATGSSGISQRENATGSESGSQVADHVALQSASSISKQRQRRKDSAYMKEISDDYFRQARKYLYMNAERPRHLTEEDAVLEICEYAGCKPKAAQDYVNISTTSISPFEKYTPPSGGKTDRNGKVMQSGTVYIVFNKAYKKELVSPATQALDAAILAEIKLNELAKQGITKESNDALLEAHRKKCIEVEELQRQLDQANKKLAESEFQKVVPESVQRAQQP